MNRPIFAASASSTIDEFMFSGPDLFIHQFAHMLNQITADVHEINRVNLEGVQVLHSCIRCTVTITAFLCLTQVWLEESDFRLAN